MKGPGFPVFVLSWIVSAIWIVAYLQSLFEVPELAWFAVPARLTVFIAGLALAVIPSMILGMLADWLWERKT